MNDIDLNNRLFRGTVNYFDGDATADTLFHYRQKNDIVWGTYEGGNVAFGVFVSLVTADGRLNMMWQYISKDGRFAQGTCISTPERLPDGRYRLNETWKTAGVGGQSGTSVVEEVLDA